MIWSATVAIRCCSRRLPSPLSETSTQSPWLIPANVERLLSRRLELDSSFASAPGCQRSAEGYSQPNPRSSRPTAALTVSGTRWRAELRQRRTRAVGWSRTAGTGDPAWRLSGRRTSTSSRVRSLPWVWRERAAAHPWGGAARSGCRRCPAASYSPTWSSRSTIGAGELSFRVRNGAGRFLSAMAAVTVVRARAGRCRPYLGNCTVDAAHRQKRGVVKSSAY